VLSLPESERAKERTTDASAQSFNTEERARNELRFYPALWGLWARKWAKKPKQHFSLSFKYY